MQLLYHLPLQNQCLPVLMREHRSHRHRSYHRPVSYTHLFSEVKGLLESFTKTPEYENYLTAKIKEALDFAGNDEITIYLSPEDRSLAEKLQHTTGTAIQLAKDSFLGGIRATIPQKNILIDHSFAGNFEAAYKEFKFDGGPEHE